MTNCVAFQLKFDFCEEAYKRFMVFEDDYSDLEEKLAKQISRTSFHSLKTPCALLPRGCFYMCNWRAKSPTKGVGLFVQHQLVASRSLLNDCS